MMQIVLIRSTFEAFAQDEGVLLKRRVLVV